MVTLIRGQQNVESHPNYGAGGVLFPNYVLGNPSMIGSGLPTPFRTIADIGVMQEP